jgi:protein-disulfide isomerase
MIDRIIPAAAIVCGVFLLACQTTSAPPPTEAAPAAAAPTAAVVDGTPIGLDELDAWIKDELFRQQTRGGDPSRIYTVRREALERMIETRALEAEAARRGLDVDTLVAQELEARGPVSDVEVVTFFKENRSRLGSTSYEELAPRIRQHLEQQRRQEVIAAIAAQATVSIELEPPRVEVAADGPSLGPADAPVTIVEFSDFQCPFCKRAVPLIYQIAEKYPSEVRIVFRHLPLDSIHPRARAAAEAAACADDQDLFWEYHDRVFESQQALSDDDLRGYAQEIGADLASFDACVASGKHAATVDADVAAASEIGVTGTPAFAVNGIMLFGLQDEQAIDALIRAELDESS